ncbi:unnamed protein product [Cercopithifilaria johnstoni]|uniref:Uncharacterized protein n=1 Tax=Cercopithifilaria johnstoni TaxID=2874296 RepID=A0A8J2MI86_9BILA|nr:unnamed protein product [Cercopithifilaria johnstoni]
MELKNSKISQKGNSQEAFAAKTQTSAQSSKSIKLTWWYAFPHHSLRRATNRVKQHSWPLPETFCHFHRVFVALLAAQCENTSSTLQHCRGASNANLLQQQPAKKNNNNVTITHKNVL